METQVTLCRPMHDAPKALPKNISVIFIVLPKLPIPENQVFKIRVEIPVFD